MTLLSNDLKYDKSNISITEDDFSMKLKKKIRLILKDYILRLLFFRGGNHEDVDEEKTKTFRFILRD